MLHRVNRVLRLCVGDSFGRVPREMFPSDWKGAENSVNLRLSKKMNLSSGRKP
jgi:hypothetical protein